MATVRVTLIDPGPLGIVFGQNPESGRAEARPTQIKNLDYYYERTI
jgi:hypothetical protein